MFKLGNERLRGDRGSEGEIKKGDTAARSIFHGLLGGGVHVLCLT